MIRYNNREFPQIYYGDFTVYEIRIGDIKIWERIVYSNFFSNDNFYIVSADNQLFNSKKE